MLHCLFYLWVFNQPLPLTISFFTRQVCGVALNLRPLLATTHEKRQPLQLSFCVERETGSLPHATLPVLSFGIQSTVTAHYCFFSSSGLRHCLKLAPPACYRKRVRYPVYHSTHEKRQSFRLSFCVERETGFGPATFTLAR